MSTSLLYHAFGVRGYRYRRTDFIEGAVVFTIEQDRSAYCCPLCDSANVEARGKTEPRVFMNLPIGGKQSFIHFAIPKVKCQDCGGASAGQGCLCSRKGVGERGRLNVTCWNCPK